MLCMLLQKFGNALRFRTFATVASLAASFTLCTTCFCFCTLATADRSLGS